MQLLTRGHKVSERWILDSIPALPTQQAHVGFTLLRSLPKALHEELASKKTQLLSVTGIIIIPVPYMQKSSLWDDK